jgi:hypothetical protein
LISIVQLNLGETAMSDGAIAYTIPETVRVSGIGRTKLYGLIEAGEVAAVKCGARTLVLAVSLQTYIASLPGVASGVAGGAIPGRGRRAPVAEPGDRRKLPEARA